jgi:hypothetical protein
VPNLNQILEKKYFIKDAANLFGFQNIRIHKDINDEILTLIVSGIENRDSYRPSFEAALSQWLDCQIAILVEENLKELYKDDVLKNAVSIDNYEGIIKIFKLPLTEINFLSAYSDKNDTFAKVNALQLANSIIFEQTHKTLTDFFKQKTDKKETVKHVMAEMGNNRFDNF